MASEPTSSARPGPSPGIKTYSSPAAFSHNSLPLFCSLPFPSLTSLRRPPRTSIRVELHLLPTGPPRSPQNRYDAATGKNVAARRLTPIRLTPRQHCLIDRLTPVSTLTMTPMKRPAFQKVAGDLVIRRPQIQDYYYPSFEPRPPIHQTSSRLHRGRQGRVTTHLQ